MRSSCGKVRNELINVQFINVDKKLVNYTDQNKVQIHGSHETGRRRQAIRVPYASHLINAHERNQEIC